MPNPFDPQALPRSLDALYNAYISGRKEDEVAARQRGIDFLDRGGLDPARITPEVMQRSQQPAMAGEDPLVAATRAHLERRTQAQALQTRGAEVGLEKEQAQARLASGQAAYYEGLASGSGGAPATQTIDGVPYLVTPSRSGPKYQPIPERRPSSTEFVARGFADKAELADQSLESVLATGFDPGATSGVLAPYPPNILKSGDRQRFEQSERQFINAVLRRESGAAIPPYELENYRRQYFPAAGDSPEVIAQKSRARKLAISGLASEGSRVPSSQATPPQDSLGGGISLDAIRAERARRMAQRNARPL